MLMDPHPSQQHAGLQNAVWWLQQEVTRPKQGLNLTSAKKYGAEGGCKSRANITWPVASPVLPIVK